jgi:hypothetical protein
MFSQYFYLHILGKLAPRKKMLITLTNARRMFSFELAVKSCGNKKAKDKLGLSCAKLSSSWVS